MSMKLQSLKRLRTNLEEQKRLVECVKDNKEIRRLECSIARISNKINEIEEMEKDERK